MKLRRQTPSAPRASRHSQYDATAISVAVVGDWFYSEQGVTYVGHTKVISGNSMLSLRAVLVSQSTYGLLTVDTDFL